STSSRAKREASIKKASDTAQCEPPHTHGLLNVLTLRLPVLNKLKSREVAMITQVVRPVPLSRSPTLPHRADLASRADSATVEGQQDRTRRVRIFISSPGDAIQERICVDRVVERLNVEFATIRLETIRWETKFYNAVDGFQPQIPEAAECDIVIGMFRHRI